MTDTPTPERGEPTRDSVLKQYTSHQFTLATSGYITPMPQSAQMHVTIDTHGMADEIVRLCAEVARERESGARWHKMYIDATEQLATAQSEVTRKDAEIKQYKNDLLEARDEERKARRALSENGFIRCDAPACNCGSYHQTQGAPRDGE